METPPFPPDPARCPWLCQRRQESTEATGDGPKEEMRRRKRTLPNQYCYYQFGAAIKKQQTNGLCYPQFGGVRLVVFLVMGLLRATQNLTPLLVM